MSNATWGLEVSSDMGEETFSKRKELLRGKLDRNQKKQMFKPMLYGVSCCMNHKHGLREKEDIKRPEALEV